MRRLATVLIAALAMGCSETSEPSPAPDTVAAALHGARQRSRDNRTSELFRLLGRNTIWTLVDRIEVDFPTFHTQGMVKIDDTFYVSSVEVVESTVRNGTPTDSLFDFSLDRSTGSGRGWLFKFDASGHLQGKVELTEGSIYHPGGMDFDGKDIWVPVAEYRPNSQSNIYRVDPETLEPTLVMREDDHIGGVVRNLHDRTIRGVSWGSRRLYTWQLARSRHGAGATRVVRSDWQPNAAFYVDYQDCHYQGVELMLCGGVAGYSTPYGSLAFGGLDLVDLRTQKPTHQVPVNQFIDEGSGPNPGLALTHNAFWAEPLGNGSLRFYFMTESDNQADLLVYDATPWINR